MTHVVYTAVVTQHEGDDFATALFPDMVGCITQAGTLEELTNNARDAAQQWINSKRSHGEPLPEPRFMADPGSREYSREGVYLKVKVKLGD